MRSVVLHVAYPNTPADQRQRPSMERVAFAVDGCPVLYEDDSAERTEGEATTNRLPLGNGDG